MKQQSMPRTTAPVKGAPKSTPVHPPTPAPRGRRREEAQPEREGPHEPSTSTTREVGPERPEFDLEGEDTSFASEAERRMELKQLTRIRYHAAKEALDIYDIAEQSLEVARDVRYRPLQAYAIPHDWKEDREGRLALTIEFKKREWVNILMLPSASSINNSGYLTKEFRQALIQVIYDALRFKLKPMVIQAAQKAMRYEQQGTSDEDQEEDPGPSDVTQRPRRTLKEGHRIPAVILEPVSTDLAGLKMLELLATRQEPHEDKIQYLK